MSGATIKVGASGGGSAIPANARKLVQDLKEIVKNGEDEIYAMLKECNMDPNETVQRLMSQDTFHEVKRKRGKKENANKDLMEARPRPVGVGTPFRGGRPIYRGTARGNFNTRNHNSEPSIGHGQSLPGKENGIYQSTRVSNVESIEPALSLSETQSKQISSGTSISVSASLTSGSPVNPTNSSHGWTSQAPRSSLNGGSGHTTLADVVKANNASLAAATLTPAIALDVQVSSSQAASNLDVISSVHPSPTDPIHHSSHDSRVSGSVRPIQRDSERVRSQGLGVSAEAVTLKSSSPKHQVSDTTDSHFEVSRTLRAIKVAVLDNIPYLQEQPVCAGDADNSVETLARPSSGGERNDQYNNTKSIQRQQQHPVGTQKSGSGLEWKPKSPAHNSVPSKVTVAVDRPSVTEATPPASPSNESAMVTAASSNFQGLNLHDNHGVIIPNHLQVPEFDQTHLSFGSFGAGFGSTFSSGFGSKDSSKSLIAIEEPAIVGDVQVEESTDASLTGSTPASYNHQPAITEVEASASNSSTIASFSSTDVSENTSPTSQGETSKADTVIQQSQQYSHVPTVSSYSGLGVGSQTVGVQYSYEPSESQPNDISRLQRFVQPYSEPTNFYSPAPRANTDTDARYPQAVSANITNKYSGGVTLFSGQNISSQAGNSIVLSAAAPTAHASQTAAITQMALTMPQPHVPVHAYPAQPAGMPISPFPTNIFGYQYLPPSYAFLHAPYQHSYTGNTSYSQPPIGSSYTPAAAINTYPPAGVAAIKYPLPQYKTATAAGNGPIAAIAAGYGNYTTTPSMFAASTAVSGGNASGYDDVNGPQYKESNLYIPSQQAEGSAVWIQTQLSRDMTGLQTNSYYNMPGQSQHTVHTHATHAHPAAAYASLYHPSQSVPATSAHQLLQQSQTLGGIGAAGAQSSAYQQPRGQLSWGSNY